MAAPLGFKTFATGDVLTAADTNGYLMQGIWVFANSTARDAAVTSPQEGNSCYLKDTDVIQVYSGSAWVTKSGGSPLTTKGDVYTYSTTDARLAVGANDTVLTADSTAATGLKWAVPASGGITLLSTTTLSGASTTISSISQSYKNLYIIAQGVLMNGSAGIDLLPNNAATATYSYIKNASVANGNNNNIFLSANGGILATGGLNAWGTIIYNYTSTVYYKNFNWNGVYVNGSSTNESTFGGGALRTTSAITSLVFACGGGQLFTGGQVLVYGVN